MHQSNLFTVGSGEQIVPLSGGRLAYWPQWLPPAIADRVFTALQAEIPWEQSRIRLYGKEIAIPRLNAWHGDLGCHYSYSGYSLPLNDWTPALSCLREQVQDTTGEHFNSVLANFYRDGSDSVSWHADDEPELGTHPVIASVSLGEERQFRMKPRDLGSDERISLPLAHGSLLVMSGATQENWLHEVPKSKKIRGPRINLTFRRVFAAAHQV